MGAHTPTVRLDRTTSYPHVEMGDVYRPDGARCRFGAASPPLCWSGEAERLGRRYGARGASRLQERFRERRKKGFCVGGSMIMYQHSDFALPRSDYVSCVRFGVGMKLRKLAVGSPAPKLSRDQMIAQRTSVWNPMQKASKCQLVSSILATCRARFQSLKHTDIAGAKECKMTAEEPSRMFATVE